MGSEMCIRDRVDDFGVVAALGNEKLESLNSLKEKARESLITVHGSIGAHLTGLKGIMHKNTAARKKSRLSKKLNSLEG